MNQTEKRKEEHVSIAVKEDVSAHHNYWDGISLVHNALPEINKEEIDTSTTLFGKKLDLPIVIAGITGGYSGAESINENLAKTAERFRIGMGVGSQRSALENRDLRHTYEVIKDYDIPLKIANIGASQITRWSFEESKEKAIEIIDMIDADALAICLNFLQEATQPEGETNGRGCYEAIKKLADGLDIPIILKESGAGISREVAKRLLKTNIAGIDVGGAGGTSFAAIEYHRARLIKDWMHQRIGKTFWDWGIPTPFSIIEVREVVKDRLPIIATGGIRTGLDGAKAIALGADIFGVAHAMLKPALRGEKWTFKEMSAIAEELRTAMFLVGARNVEELSMVDVVWIW